VSDPYVRGRHRARIPFEVNQHIDRPEWVVKLDEFNSWVTSTCANGHTKIWTRGGRFLSACPSCEKP
jgi:hypothetical protein